MFAKTMIKYILGILISALLLFGFQEEFDTKERQLRSADEFVSWSVLFQSYVLSNNCITSKAAIKKPASQRGGFGCEKSGSILCECMPEHFIPFRSLFIFFLHWKNNFSFFLVPDCERIFDISCHVRSGISLMYYNLIEPYSCTSFWVIVAL